MQQLAHHQLMHKLVQQVISPLQEHVLHVVQEWLLVLLLLQHLHVTLDIIMIQLHLHVHHVELELMHVLVQQLLQVVSMDFP